MGTLSTMTERKWLLPAIGIIAGIALGLLYAWQINPVQWIDGEPVQLRADLRKDYLRMAIDSYAANKNSELALDRYDALGEFAQETLDAVGADPGEVSSEAIQSFRALLEIERAVGPEAEAEAAQPAEDEGAFAGVSRYIVPVCGITLALGLLLAGVLFLRSRGRGDEEESGTFEGVMQPGAMISEGVGEPELRGAAVSLEDTLATFRTIYAIGDDDYDDSFSIESGTGEFLGECGVGVGELIGVGEPKKVSAFEVWLFDKNDIQTVTKVLMSDYAFRDDESRSRLAAKGDPVAAEPGGVISLQTASLEVEARIVDMSYGQGALPDQSYFERLTIELRAWSRDGAGA